MPNGVFLEEQPWRRVVSAEITRDRKYYRIALECKHQTFRWRRKDPDVPPKKLRCAKCQPETMK